MVVKKMIYVMGGTGQYKRQKKKNGAVTASTAASPYGFPFPDPVEMYHTTVPTQPPMKVLTMRATRPNVVSPRKRARVSWPMNLVEAVNTGTGKQRYSAHIPHTKR